MVVQQDFCPKSIHFFIKKQLTRFYRLTAFTPKQNNFPKTPNIHIININVNVISPFLQSYLLV